MIKSHAHAAICTDSRPFGRRITMDALSLVSSVHRTAGQLLLALTHRVAMRRIERFSDHRLHDIGFEREWDGSVIPLAGHPSSRAATL
ncbi:hypothetical protein [Brucella tritici]|uniref:DUF1127 domain-containing protein n=1 Tax=Brucella tritici TaxID=94626 RepID=A0A6L3Y531_9HYPH|nr:hypothetical protein [Brucella tritici]KAB2676359.1 hypothetical protein F9L08_26490 [Brucella tritici]